MDTIGKICSAFSKMIFELTVLYVVFFGAFSILNMFGLFTGLEVALWSGRFAMFIYALMRIQEIIVEPAFTKPLVKELANVYFEVAVLREMIKKEMSEEHLKAIDNVLEEVKNGKIRN